MVKQKDCKCYKSSNVVNKLVIHRVMDLLSHTRYVMMSTVTEEWHKPCKIINRSDIFSENQMEKYTKPA